ncbi:MAG: SpoIIE family protein phosphatase [Melioribacteraceae bacterium]|nr:SpoIIE family protein phosphatase [Melioribacteraceae bacterium]
MKKIFQYIYFCFFLTCRAVFPGNEILKFEHFNSEHGLSQSTVNAIVQDKKGFLWFGTEDGLNRYDGYNFKVYYPEIKNSNSLSHNFILALFEDTDDCLWIGTNGGGLNKFDKVHNKFTVYKHDLNDINSLSSNIVTGIYKDKNGIIWVGTDNGLNKFDERKNKLVRYISSKHNNSISSDYISVIKEDSDGVLWIGTNNGLNKYNSESDDFERYLQNEKNEFVGDYIYDLYEDKVGAIWIGTDQGLNRYDKFTGTFKNYTHNKYNPASLSNSIVRTICEDDLGLLWIGTDGGGISVFNRLTTTFERHSHSVYNNKSLSKNEIRKIFFDNSGIVWVSTYGGGLNKFDREREKFNLYYRDITKQTSLSNNMIWNFCVDSSNILWIGTDGGGLNSYDKREKSYKTYQHIKNKNSITNNYVRAIIEDRIGNIWIGTDGGGLDKLNPGTGEFKHYKAKQDNNSLSSNRIRPLFEDSMGNIWIGTTDGGLNKLDVFTDKIISYQNIPDMSTSISHNFVYSICEDIDGYIWVGTWGGGLNKFDPVKQSFKRFKHDADDSKSLSNDLVLTILEDSNRNLWFGTSGGGLNLFNKKDQSFTHFRVQDGLPSDVIYGILEDKSGDLWLSTNKGLSRFDKKTLTFTNFNTSDGLQSNEFNGGAYYKAASGEMFFGGINGFNSFFPSDIKQNKQIPKVIITDFLISNKSVVPGDKSVLSKSIFYTDEIELTYEDDMFSFEFSSLNFASPEKNLYKYKMEGLNKDWIFSNSNKRFVTYTNMEPGEYTFRVMGSNNDGIWNDEGDSVKIIIYPPIWATLWFRIILFVLIVILVYSFIKRKTNVIRMKTELKGAHDAQMSIMPQSDPVIEGFDISGICLPAFEVGGDFFEYIWLNEEKTKLGIAVGDVSGKAMKSAVTAIMTSGLILAEFNGRSKTDKTMSRLNKPLFQKTSKSMFTALLLASFDKESKECEFTNAGLIRPILKKNKVVTHLESEGPKYPLGILENVEYENNHIKLESGDVLIFLSDGIPEAQNKDQHLYGLNILTDLIWKMDTDKFSAHEIRNNIIDDVKKFSDGTEHPDDMTLVVIKVK